MEHFFPISLEKKESTFEFHIVLVNENDARASKLRNDIIVSTISNGNCSRGDTACSSADDIRLIFFRAQGSGTINFPLPLQPVSF